MNAVAEKFNVWDNILNSIEKKLNRQIFDAWFRTIKFDGISPEEKIISLRASQVNKDWVNSYYNDFINQTLGEIGMADHRIEWVIDTPGEQLPQIEDKEELDFKPLPLIRYPEITPAKTSGFSDADLIESSLNPKYTFQTFVVGSCNQFAHAAALAVAEAPGKTYNPMFIYGGVGLGKTHLMHAIGHSIKQQNRHARVAYISAEKFMNELINAIRFDKTQVFRDKYRSIDVLLMDDVQFMAGKERTQEEFFHTFNALHNDQKQIVITSDCPPREIPTLEERLHSRFEWGLIADMEPPDLETKVAILKRKADMDGVSLPDEVVFFMANKVKNNIRELEGSLVRLIAISSLRGLPITKMLAQDAMRNILGSDSEENLTMERISRAVASHYKMTVEDLKSKNNSRHIAVPRQVAMYLCKRLTKHSLPEIGREFGGKHHTTVMHSVDKIDSLIKEDKDFHRIVSDLIDSLCN